MNGTSTSQNSTYTSVVKVESKLVIPEGHMFTQRDVLECSQ